MNRTLRLALAPLAFALALTSSALAVEPGYVDFGKFTGPEKGQFVEVTLGKGMLKLASFFAKHSDAEAGELVAGISRVRVNVVGLDDGNRTETTERVAKIRKELLAQGWDQIVTARGGKHEDVAIFMKQRDGEVIQGLVVTVIDERKDEAVLVNVVGHIKPEQIARLGDQLQIKQLRVAANARQ